MKTRLPRREASYLSISFPVTSDGHTKQTEENYRLTEENWATIDPMIGLSEDDIAAFFNNN